MHSFPALCLLLASASGLNLRPFSNPFRTSLQPTPQPPPQAVSRAAVVPYPGLDWGNDEQPTGVPLTGNTLQAALKMRCDTSGAGYAIFWANENDKLVVAGDYVTDAQRRKLADSGLTESFAEMSESWVLDPNGDGPVSTTYRTQSPTFIKDVESSNMLRKELAAKFQIAEIAFIPFEAGVLEYGTSEGSDTTSWSSFPQCPLMPKEQMRVAFEHYGASYTMFWQLQSNNKYVVVADYVKESRRRALAQSRGDQETFCSGSRRMEFPARGAGLLATAVRTREEQIVTDVSTLKRAALAKEFKIKVMHFVPTDDGVLEYGTPVDTYLDGATLAASLKMHCDLSGACYAIYWKEFDGKVTAVGDHVTPEQRAAMQAEGRQVSFADASKDIVLATSGDGPVALVLRTQEMLYIQDVGSCGTMQPQQRSIAQEYGITSMCLIPVQGGVMEYGISKTGCTTTWNGIRDACTAVIPKAELEGAFNRGATHALFWIADPELGEFKMAASYVIPERVRALRIARGDDKTFVGESQKFEPLLLAGKGPVATAFRSGKEMVILEPTEEGCDPNSEFRRCELALEFGVGDIHFVPTFDGVLEYGRGGMR